MTPSRQTPAISIGAVLGDSDSQSMEWKRSISALGKQVMELREGVDSPLRVNVVFHVDGRLIPNEFQGVRTGRFAKKDAHLLVQAAVPAGPMTNHRDVLMELLGYAVDAAENFAQRRGIADSLSEIRGVIEGLH